jgi:uncharacterized protein
MNVKQKKLENLKAYLKSLDSVAVAFSGGVDSTFLLKVASDVLGDKAIAVTALSASYPKREFDEACSFAKENGIVQIAFESEELDIEGFSSNPINRCYLCKKELFLKIKDIAKENGLKNIVEGSNFDDNQDYRPGHIAIEELNITSPLRFVALTKNEIRELSKEMGLLTWNKPSFACLSSRFPYGERITLEKLTMVEKAEQIIIDHGFSQVRVRHHGNLARIEVEEKEFEKMLKKEVRIEIFEKLKKIGFTYVSIDIKGYRTGSMNETLDL